VRLRELLLHELARLGDVGALLEEQDDRREARHRLRAQDGGALHAVEEVGLQRHGDQLLDLLGRQPERLGLDLDVGWCELGQDVDRRVTQLHETGRHHGHGGAEDQQPEAQRRRDDPAHQTDAVG
jgi:hypothetical protein